MVDSQVFISFLNTNKYNKLIKKKVLSFSSFSIPASCSDFVIALCRSEGERFQK